MSKVISDNSLAEHLVREESLFSRDGMVVLTGDSKESILEIHGQEKADLILLDLELPAMDIEKFCAHIRTNEALKNVSIVTASSREKSDLDRCLACGVNAVVIKPVHHEELVRTVTQLLQVRNREAIRVLMRISVVGKARDTFYSTSMNVSMSGILLETDRRLSVGETVTLSFYLRLNKLDIRGKVVRSQAVSAARSRYGIQFETLTDTTSRLIEEYIRMRRAI